MRSRRGFSLLELLLALAIGAVVISASIAFVVAPRSRITTQSCSMQENALQLRAEEYTRRLGRLPSADLRELRTPSTPIPTCPVDGRPYTYDANTRTIRPHAHP